MLTEPLRTHRRCRFSVLPQTWWGPAVAWVKVCLQQPMFCSRESTNCLMIQENEKSTQKSSDEAFLNYAVSMMDLFLCYCIFFSAADRLLLAKVIGLSVFLSGASSLLQLTPSLICNRPALSATPDAFVSRYSGFATSKNFMYASFIVDFVLLNSL